MLHWSLFSHTKIENNKVRIYNTKYRSIIELDFQDYQLINHCIQANVFQDQDLKYAVAQLIQKKYICDDDEWNLFLKERKEQYVKKTGNFMCYFIPSWNCNFQCTYCHYYKNIFGTDKMTIEAIKKSAKYAVNYMKKLYQEDESSINVTIMLYGGEPLLSTNENMIFLDEMKRLLSTYPKHSELSIAMITNGYLLNEEMIKKYKEHNLKGLQITIDGDEQNHNKRRIHKDNMPTYREIVNHVKLAAMKYDIPITIRINVDEENIDSIPVLLNNLREEGIHRNVKLSLSPVFQNINVGGATDNSEVLKKFSNIFSEAARLDYPFVFPTTSCSFFSKEFIVLANEKVYTCPSLSAIDFQSIDDINCVDCNIIERYKNLDGKCERCCWAPLCGGGCNYQNVVAKKKVCMKTMYLLMVEAYMMNYTYMNRLIGG